MELKEKIKLFVEQMQVYYDQVDSEATNFKTKCVYTNPGDMHYLGTMIGDAAGTHRCLERLKEILEEEE